MTMLSSAPSAPAPQQASTDLFRGFSSLSSRLTDRLPGSLGTNFEGLISGVKNFLPANRDTTLTKIVESVMEPTSASSSAIAKTEDYLYYDPRNAAARGVFPGARQAGDGVKRGGQEASFGQRRQGFSEAIVFTVGGGSMDEYGNLQDWVKRKHERGEGRRRVVYGSTEIINAEEFMKGLEKLGREIS